MGICIVEQPWNLLALDTFMIRGKIDILSSHIRSRAVNSNRANRKKHQTKAGGKVMARDTVFGAPECGYRSVYSYYEFSPKLYRLPCA